MAVERKDGGIVIGANKYARITRINQHHANKKINQTIQVKNYEISKGSQCILSFLQKACSPQGQGSQQGQGKEHGSRQPRAQPKPGRPRWQACRRKDRKEAGKEAKDNSGMPNLQKEAGTDNRDKDDQENRTKGLKVNKWHQNT